MFQSLKSMVSDDTGAISSMRCAFLLILAAVLVPHVVLSIKTGQPISLSNGELQLLGGAASAKLFQNYQESQTPTPPKP